MKKMYKKIILFVWLWFFVVSSFAAGTDYSSLSNNLALAPGLQGTTQGYDLLSGKVTQSIPLVKGNIPFTMQYHASLRLEGEGGVNLYQELDEGGVADWSNEYSGYVITSTVPSTNVSTYIMQLPGNNEKYIITKDGGKFKRLYYNGAGQFEAKTFYSENLRDISFSQINGSFVIVKDGVKFTASISKTLDSVFGNTTIPAYLFKFTEIEFQDGRKLKLNYDNGYNLVQVKDNRNNILNILREYKKAGAINQSYLERKLITGVELISGSNSQKSKITYQESEVSSILNRSKIETRYTISAINSVIVGTVAFQYENQSRGYWIQYVANNTGRSISTFTVNDGNYPIIKKVLDQNNNILREYEYANVWQFYGSSTLFLVYTTQITSYSTVNNQKVQRSISMYDDMRGNFLNRFTVNGQDQVMDFIMTPPTLGMYDESNLSIMTAATGTLTVSGNYPGLLSGSIPVRSVKFNPFTHRLLSITDFNGNVSNFSFDNQNRLIGKAEGVGNVDVQTSTYNYTTLMDGSTNIYPTPNEIITDRQKVTNKININGWIEKQNITYKSGGVKNIEYSYFDDLAVENYGLIKRVDGPRNDINDNIEFTYDDFGNKVTSTQVINNNSVVTKYLYYNSFAQPERIIHPSGLVDQFIYNADGTLQEKITGNGGETGNVSDAVTSYTYDYLKRIKSETDPDGEVTAYDYDILGRLIKTVAADGSIKNQSYFDNGIIKTSESTSIISNEINTEGRISKTRNGLDTNKNWITFNYDGNGNVTQSQTALGIIKKWTYDSLNRNITYTDGDGGVRIQNYDKANTVIASFDGVNSGSSFMNYLYGNLLFNEGNSDYGYKIFKYNPAEQMTSSAHGNRGCQYLNIDILGRVGEIKCFVNFNNDPTYAYNYQYTYDGSRFGNLDNIISNTSYGVNTQYTYDNLNRIIEKKQTNKALVTWGGASNTLILKYNYSVGGKVTAITMPSGRTINYNYESSKDRLNSIHIENIPFISNISYNDIGQLYSWNLENSNSKYSLSYDLNKNGVIKNLSFFNKNNINLFSEDYEFDQDGRVISILHNNSKTLIEYDGSNRVRKTVKTYYPNNLEVNSLEYDKNGNTKFLTKNINGFLESYNIKIFANSNRIQSISDQNNVVIKNANYLDSGELRFPPFLSTYDGNGQMRYSGGGNGQYYMVYNHKNERTIRSLSTADNNWYAGAIQYIYDENSNLIGEYTPNGMPIIEYVWMGNRPIAAIYGSGTGKIYAVVTDHNATPRMLVDNDTGNAVWKWESTAFGLGLPVGIVTFNLRFPGQYYDALTGLHYNLNRYYNPELGRYMEPDPIGLEGGSNPYVYADNNPISNIDPSGLDCIGGSCSSGFEQGMYDWWPGYKFGTGFYNSFTSGSNQFSFWEGVDGAASFLGGFAKGASWAVREADDAISAVRFAFPELKSIGSGAVSASQGAKLSEYYRQLDKFGGAGVRELQSGKYRFYGELTPARTSGEMVGARLVREWNPMTNMNRTWYETLDHAGRVRSVAPKPVTESLNHRIFDINGKYVGRR